MNMFNLKGKKAIVTGASGGIGYALVKGMVEAGIEVAMLDYSESLEQIRDELSALGKVYAFRCDLTDRKNRELIFDQAVEALGGTLDILVNSAGVQKRGLLIEFKDEDWDFVMEVNINAVFAMTRSAGKYMIPQRSGKIINMASIVISEVRMFLPMRAQKELLYSLQKPLQTNGVNTVLMQMQ